MESSFSRLQKNVLETKRRENREAPPIVVWFETKYNRRRSQRGVGKLIPAEFETVYAAADTA